MSEYQRGYIYVQGEYAGILEEADEGYTFCYDIEYMKKRKCCRN